MPEEKKKEAYERTIMDLELMDYKMHSISDIIMLKRGHLSFRLPKGVEPISATTSESLEEFVEVKENPKQETGVKKFFKSIFRKKKDN